MLLPIAQLGQPVLRRAAEPVPPEMIATADFQRFLEAMRHTLTHHRGAGLAAPQVFVGRRVFLAQVAEPAEDEDAPPPPAEVFINPRVVAASDDTDGGWEGCLSFPELLVYVRRPRRVRVEALDAQGRARTLDLEGFAGRVVQHENDHLDGVLTLDRAASTRDVVKSSEIEAVLRDRGDLPED
jgi:peptide deformylase